MARTYTLSELITICRRRADMENSQFVSDSEITDYVNESVAELHDLLIASYEDYHLSSRVIQISGNQDIYPLPEDFLKELRMEVDNDGSFNQPIQLRKFMMPEWTRNTTPIILGSVGLISAKYRIVGNNLILMPRPTSSGYLRMWYYPPAKKLTSSARTFTDSAVSTSADTITYASHNYFCSDRISFTNSGGSLPSPITSGTDYYVIPTSKNAFKLASSVQNAFDNVAIDITSASGGGTNTISDDLSIYDGQNGWEEYVVVDVAAKMKEKQEDDVSSLFARKMALIQRIRDAAKSRDIGQAQRIVDVHKQEFPFMFGGPVI